MSFHYPYYGYGGGYPADRYYHQMQQDEEYAFDPPFQIEVDPQIGYPIHELQSARSVLINCLKGYGWNHTPAGMGLLPRLGIPSAFGNAIQDAVSEPPDEGGKFYHLNESGMGVYLNWFRLKSADAAPPIDRFLGKRDDWGQLLNPTPGRIVKRKKGVKRLSTTTVEDLQHDSASPSINPEEPSTQIDLSSAETSQSSAKIIPLEPKDADDEEDDSIKSPESSDDESSTPPQESEMEPPGSPEKEADEKSVLAQIDDLISSEIAALKSNKKAKKSKKVKKEKKKKRSKSKEKESKAKNTAGDDVINGSKRRKLDPKEAKNLEKAIKGVLLMGTAADDGKKQNDNQESEKKDTSDDTISADDTVSKSRQENDSPRNVESTKAKVATNLEESGDKLSQRKSVEKRNSSDRLDTRSVENRKIKEKTSRKASDKTAKEAHDAKDAKSKQEKKKSGQMEPRDDAAKSHSNRVNDVVDRRRRSVDYGAEKKNSRERGGLYSDQIYHEQRRQSRDRGSHSSDYANRHDDHHRRSSDYERKSAEKYGGGRRQSSSRRSSPSARRPSPPRRLSEDSRRYSSVDRASSPSRRQAAAIKRSSPNRPLSHSNKRPSPGQASSPSDRRSMTEHHNSLLMTNELKDVDERLFITSIKSSEIADSLPKDRKTEPQPARNVEQPSSVRDMTSSVSTAANSKKAKLNDSASSNSSTEKKLKKKQGDKKHKTKKVKEKKKSKSEKKKKSINKTIVNDDSGETNPESIALTAAVYGAFEEEQRAQKELDNQKKLDAAKDDAVAKEAPTPVQIDEKTAAVLNVEEERTVSVRRLAEAKRTAPRNIRDWVPRAVRVLANETKALSLQPEVKEKTIKCAKGTQKVVRVVAVNSKKASCLPAESVETAVEKPQTESTTDSQPPETSLVVKDSTSGEKRNAEMNSKDDEKDLPVVANEPVEDIENAKDQIVSTGASDVSSTEAESDEKKKRNQTEDSLSTKLPTDVDVSVKNNCDKSFIEKDRILHAEKKNIIVSTVEDIEDDDPLPSTSAEIPGLSLVANYDGEESLVVNDDDRADAVEAGDDDSIESISIVLDMNTKEMTKTCEGTSILPPKVLSAKPQLLPTSMATVITSTMTKSIVAKSPIDVKPPTPKNEDAAMLLFSSSELKVKADSAKLQRQTSATEIIPPPIIGVCLSESISASLMTSSAVSSPSNSSLSNSPPALTAHLDQLDNDAVIIISDTPEKPSCSVERAAISTATLTTTTCTTTVSVVGPVTSASMTPKVSLVTSVVTTTATSLPAVPPPPIPPAMLLKSRAPSLPTPNASNTPRPQQTTPTGGGTRLHCPQNRMRLEQSAAVPSSFRVRADSASQRPLNPAFRNDVTTTTVFAAPTTGAGRGIRFNRGPPLGSLPVSKAISNVTSSVSNSSSSRVGVTQTFNTRATPSSSTAGSQTVTISKPPQLLDLPLPRRLIPGNGPPKMEEFIALNSASTPSYHTNMAATMRATTWRCDCCSHEADAMISMNKHLTHAGHLSATCCARSRGNGALLRLAGKGPLLNQNTRSLTVAVVCPKCERRMTSVCHAAAHSQAAHGASGGGFYSICPVLRAQSLRIPLRPQCLICSELFMSHRDLNFHWRRTGHDPMNTCVRMQGSLALNHKDGRTKHTGTTSVFRCDFGRCAQSFENDFLAAKSHVITHSWGTSDFALLFWQLIQLPTADNYFEVPPTAPDTACLAQGVENGRVNKIMQHKAMKLRKEEARYERFKR